MAKETTNMLLELGKRYRNNKTGLIALINEMEERDVDNIVDELDSLIMFKDAHVGKWAFPKSKEPCTLLHDFWQRSSDACPLEATEAENQEKEFYDWVYEKYDELEFPIT